MKLVCSILVLIAIGVQAHPHNGPHHAGHHAYPYGYYGYGNIPINYRYNSGLYPHHHRRGCPGNTQTCPAGYTFRPDYCGCFKDGDELPATPPPKNKVPVPIPVPVPVPLRPAAPRPPIPPPPPTCQRILPCTVGQVFDERRCQCVCIVQIRQCPGRTTYNPSQCRCECNPVQTCLSFQRFNTLLCVCEPTNPPAPLPPLPLPPLPLPPAPLPPAPLPPLPLPPAPLPPAPLPPQPGCPPSTQFLCTRFQTLNPATCRCECSPLAASRCRSPQRLNPETCDCECSRASASSCNTQLQRFNFDNCECECINVFVTTQRTIPGALVPGPSIPGPLIPGPAIPVPAPPAPFFPPFIPRTGTPGTPGSRKRRRAVKKREAKNGHVLGPNGEFKVRRMRLKRRTGPTGPGTPFIPFFPPPALPPTFIPGPSIPGPPIPGPLVPGPSRTITERRLVPAPCPAGTFLEGRSCECF